MIISRPPPFFRKTYQDQNWMRNDIPTQIKSNNSWTMIIGQRNLFLVGFSPFSKGWAVINSKHVVDFEFHWFPWPFQKKTAMIFSSSGNPGWPAFRRSKIWTKNHSSCDVDSWHPFFTNWGILFSPTLGICPNQPKFPTQRWRIFLWGFHNRRCVVKKRQNLLWDFPFWNSSWTVLFFLHSYISSKKTSSKRCCLDLSTTSPICKTKPREVSLSWKSVAIHDFIWLPSHSLHGLGMFPCDSHDWNGSMFDHKKNEVKTMVSWHKILAQNATGWQITGVFFWKVQKNDASFDNFPMVFSPANSMSQQGIRFESSAFFFCCTLGVEDSLYNWRG